VRWGGGGGGGGEFIKNKPLGLAGVSGYGMEAEESKEAFHKPLG
jgi:hypothetical protein